MPQLFDYEIDVITPDAMKEVLHAEKVEYLRTNVSRGGRMIYHMVPGNQNSNICRFVSDNGYTYEIAQTSFGDFRSYSHCLVYKTGTFLTDEWYRKQ